MVYNGKPYFLMDDLGVPPFSETPIWHLTLFVANRKGIDPLFSWGQIIDFVASIFTFWVRGAVRI